MAVDSPDVQTNDQRARRSRFAPLGIIFGVLGLLLFAYFVRRAGVGQILDGIQRLGAGFLLLLAISSTRYIVRALAWTRCVERPHRLPFRDAVAARLMGDALGNIIPFASVAVSEPSKAVFVKHRVPLLVGLSALAIENIFYALSVSLFIFAGTATLLLNFSLPKPLRYASIGALAATLIIIPVGYLLIRRQKKFLSGALQFFGNRGVAPNLVAKLTPRAQTLEERVYGFYQRNRQSFLSIFALDMCFHLAGIAEIYTALLFISPIAPTLQQAFILESVNRIINVAFKFIPLRAGVDEGGTGQVSRVLGFARGIGETLAIIRKGRDIFWSAIGLLLIWRKGFSLKSLSDE
ncbi:MAG: flippase-like domain-containing protein [Acidobacteria bacterium]|nr:flippase-like domain-containing protein [Acidobacteriota bacterium]MCA1627376.1 flippase-like domain-containing protein [Acidobacteriota bacterium]